MPLDMRRNPATPAGLTPRELEILALLMRELSDAEIARLLQRSVKTVGHHVSAILGKLAVNSRGAAVQLARSRGYFGSAGSAG
jgi:DNA-binding CsgD family transcriptional regulator